MQKVLSFDEQKITVSTFPRFPDNHQCSDEQRNNHTFAMRTKSTNENGFTHNKRTRVYLLFRKTNHVIWQNVDGNFS